MDNRYVTWTLRFVPNTLRGEFVNIGVLVGSDHQGWAIRYTRHFRRAKDFAGGLEPRLGPALALMERRVRATNAANRGIPAAFGEDHDRLTVGHIEHLHSRWNNAVQFSDARFVSGASADQVADMLFRHYVPTSERAPREQRRTIIRREYRAEITTALESLGHGRLEEQAQAQVDQSSQRFDFAVVSNGLEKLTEVISMTRQDQDDVRKDLQSMGYIFTQLRRHGGILKTRKSKQSMQIRSNIPISIIYDEPESDDQQRTLDIARSIWRDVNVQARSQAEITRDVTDSVRLLATVT